MVQTSSETDREALIALYNATGGPDWRYSNHWLSDVPISEWEGVIIDDNGRVTELFLGGNQLSGEIPPELGILANLTRLHLDGNQLSGEIPPELANLANLKYLDLGGNQLSGEIPAELDNLANLIDLALNDNQLSGEIPAELGDLASVTRLALSYNQLSGRIPPELGNLANVSGVGGSGAPPLLGPADGGAVPAGEQGQPQVGEGQAAACGGDAGGEAEALQGRGELGGPLLGHPQQAGQVAQGDPGPVGEEVEGAFLGGLEQGGQQVLGDAPPGPAVVDVFGQGRPHQGRLGGERTAGAHPVQGGAQVDGGVDRGQPPHRVVGCCGGGLAFQCEERRRGRAGQQPAGVAQPHLVGEEQLDAAAGRPLPEPPESLGEARPIGGAPLADDGKGAPVGEG